MSSTPVLGLPLIAAAQAQKHVTHNEALLALDALVQCAVQDKDLAAPPAATAGQRYIVPAAATGEWAGKAAMIAAWQDGYGWRYFQPARGYLAFVADESLLYVFDGTAWVSLTSALAAIQNLGRLGIGTTADATNPFSAKLNKALWTARTAAEGGDGDLRYTLNKETASDVLSLLFQTGFSGRLELGLIGSDDPSLKVSVDGSSWRTALAIQASTGGLDYLSASTSVASSATTDIGSAPTRKADITGATTITSFGPGAHKERLIRFTGALTLTHNATSLILPGGANIVTAAGDTAIATSDGSNNWTVRSYTRAAMPPISAAGTTGLGSVALSGNLTFDATAVQRQFQFTQTRGNMLVYANATQFGILDSTVSDTVLGYNYSALKWRTLVDFQSTVDGYANLGGPSNRFGTLYAASGSINTSDAREKAHVDGQPIGADLLVMPLTEAEIGWAQDLAREIGAFKFLVSIAEKGDAARTHLGMTVQRAIALGEARGLAPSRYAFICHDEWEATEAEPEILDDDGTVLREAKPAKPAGDRYSFRTDQLALFILRGQQARLAAIESQLAD